MAKGSIFDRLSAEGAAQKARLGDADITRGENDGTLRKPGSDPGAVQPEDGQKGVPKDDEVFKAQGEKEKAQPVGSAEALDTTLREKFGEKLIDGLLEQGVLRFAKNSDEQPPGIRSGIQAILRKPAEGPHVATLYFDKVSAERAPGILMHELGEHYGIVRLLGQERYNVMLNDLRKMKDEPEVRAAWDHVKKNYIGPGTASKLVTTEDPMFIREVAARLTETQPELPFVRRLINEIRAFFYEKFGTTMANRVDANLIRGLAASALRKVSQGDLSERPTTQPTRPFVPSRTAQNVNRALPPQ